MLEGGEFRGIWIFFFKTLFNEMNGYKSASERGKMVGVCAVDWRTESEREAFKIYINMFQ
jgi:hypothetical protein